ncbi:Uncharacterised protein [uncultured archaeon]|nr:Uncharacterised protein [uncultured archaeon]
MAKEPLYFRPCSVIDPVLNLGSLAYGDLVETPYAHEEIIEQDQSHSINTGLENQVK